MNDSKSNKFIVFYQIPASVMADWAKTDPNTRKAAEEKMKAEWQKWMSDHAQMVTVTEACGKTKQITAGGISDTRNDICLYSFIEAESHEAAAKAFENHPHLQDPTIIHRSDGRKGNVMKPKVDAILSKAKKWQEEFEKLRMIILGCQLTEELKWGWPCYTFQKSNIVLIHGFKEYCALLFFKGVLLKDPHGILIQQTPHVQAGRQIRFSSVQEIVKLKSILKAYIHEAMEVEKAGLKVHLKKTSDFKVPEEFQTKLDKNPGLKKAFEALTPGRQRAYIFYFSAPKQSQTKEARVEKCMQPILNGKGLNDP